MEVESTKQLTQMTAVALLATGRIDDAREVEQPWFDRGQFDPDVLDDPAIAADFRNWVNVGNAGDVVASLGPHLHTGFSNGKDRATEED